MAKSELRKDLIVDKYVIIAPRRGQRPHDVKTRQESASSSYPCGFCPVNIDRVKDLAHIGPRLKNWKIKVVKNIYPAVSLDNPRAYGVQEVLIETPDHHTPLDELPIEHIAALLRMYADRTKAISTNKKIEYIMTFKNSGGTAGASLQHSHSQIFATNFIPPHLLHRSQKAQEHRMRTGRCAYCDMIKIEEKSPRLVYKDKLVTVFCPYASENNYEVWVMPRRHIDNITLFTPKERLAMAKYLQRCLAKISELQLPYNYYFHQVVNDDDQHVYIRIRPRGSVWAGVEIGSGVIINPIPPEKAALYYKKR